MVSILKHQDSIQLLKLEVLTYIHSYNKSRLESYYNDTMFICKQYETNISIFFS